MITWIKNIFRKNKEVLILDTVVRERLKLMYVIETDQAKYYAYNTQTVEDDWVNIEIEEDRNGIKRIILEEEILDDSWDSMGGSSFYSLVIDSKRHLKDYIKERGEFIVSEKEIA